MAAFTACTSAGRYLDWPDFVTAGAVDASVPGTPTVRVNGTEVDPDGDRITAAVQQAH